MSGCFGYLMGAILLLHFFLKIHVLVCVEIVPFLKLILSLFIFIPQSNCRDHWVEVPSLLVFSLKICVLANYMF